MTTFEQAIETARQNILIQQAVAQPDAQYDYVILQLSSGEYRVYRSSAWTRPAEHGRLPWLPPPAGEIVATVALDGSVEMAR